MHQPLLYLLLILACAGPALLRGQDIRDLDQYIEQARRQWNVPGMAVAVVKDGQVLLAKGYGEKQLGSNDPVDAQTIFNIGSTTKAITAVAMGILVDEGKVGWDDRVAEHLPEFQLNDAYATRDMRVRDLLTHNLGLPNADYLWYFDRFSPEEILHRMRYVEPAYPLRGGYTYQNIMYLAAGKLIETRSGISWEAFIQTRIFAPLGMTNSYPNKALSQAQANRSTAHNFRYGTDEIIPIGDFSADSIAAAGAVWSSIGDMSKWVVCMLDSSKYDGGRLLQPETWAELFKPHTIIPQDQFYPTAKLTRPKWTTYALGWFQHDYNGRNINFHTGSLPGTVAMIGLIHDEDLGYYFLGNLDHAEVRHALMYRIFDAFGPNDPQRDWSTEIQFLYGPPSMRAAALLSQQENSRMKGTQPSRRLEAYAGTYRHPAWGDIVIEYAEGRLRVAHPAGLSGDLTHWHYNTFQLDAGIPYEPPIPCTFQLDAQGNVAIARIIETFERVVE